jgi:hypothetical protein
METVTGKDYGEGAGGGASAGVGAWRSGRVVRVLGILWGRSGDTLHHVRRHLAGVCAKDGLGNWHTCRKKKLLCGFLAVARTGR